MVEKHPVIIISRRIPTSEFKSQESKPTNQPIESFPRCGQDHSMQGTT